MSSDFNPHLLASKDIGVIREVLRNTGFQYEEPMGELDRIAARYALDLYQQGTREPHALVAAISAWAEGVSEHGDRSMARGEGA
ncbi:hypothetical protein [Rhizobium sp. C4]|uniref:hypothetical protein n=1 Tax=Rhizobium sp. C4 TaxID=1349800 RepID=UPI001E64C074|nr:hypothetical protein [Rhizobium sp. C4]MCD2172781.1 hypothetical protein [Rhizobium sp. C4]